MNTRRNIFRAAGAFAIAALTGSTVRAMAQGPQVPAKGELPGWRPCKITGGRYRFGNWTDVGATADEEEGLEWMGRLFMREEPSGRVSYGLQRYEGAFVLHDTPSSVLKDVREQAARRRQREAEYRALHAANGSRRAI